MKAAILLLAVTTTGLGASSVYLYQQVETERDNVRVQTSRAQALEEELKIARRADHSRFAALPDAPSPDAAPSAGPTPGGAPAQPGNRQANADERRQRQEAFRENMRNNPEMQQRMRAGQQQVVNRMYGDFIKDSRLSPQQAERFAELLGERQRAAMEAGRQDYASPEERRAAIEQAQAQADAELLALLGADKYVEYQDYQKSMPARMQAGQISQQLSALNTPLKDDQQKRLIAVLNEERNRVAQPVATGGGNVPRNSPEQLQWIKDYNKRVLSRASQIMTSEQLKQFQQVQEYQLMQQQMGGRGGRGGFGNGPGGG